MIKNCDRHEDNVYSLCILSFMHVYNGFRIKCDQKL